MRRHGADFYDGDACRFTVWAPRRKHVHLQLAGRRAPIPMDRDDDGYWTVDVAGVAAGDRYTFRLDDEITRPDPASAHQPDGVHAPSAVVDHRAFAWRDADFVCPPHGRWILYELHVGTFTAAGTFAAAAERLGDLRELGIDAINVMPVCPFPGARNWGYDGVYPYAVQESYGGPQGFRAFVAACHAQGIAVVLDVVYNHLGPEGNYLRDFGPYFTTRYGTPWGDALNFDGPESDHVRAYFLGSAHQWLVDYHVDALRLDAVHAITDFSAVPFLADLTALGDAIARETGRRITMIAESDLNDARVIQPRAQGGLGFAAQWSDDFHHSLHTLLTGERTGYYEDFGAPAQLRRALDEGYVYSGQHSRHRRRRHGNSAADLPCDRFVVSVQNHDQVGNRLRGDRLATMVDLEVLKVAAGLLLLSPCVPMLFMGEEYGETAPFPYFVSHEDRELVEAVSRGRAEAFASFGWAEAPPLPHEDATFRNAVLAWDRRTEGDHGLLLALHRALIRWRRETPALQSAARADNRTLDTGDDRLVCLRRRHGDAVALIILNATGDPVAGVLPADALPVGRAWRRAFATADPRWRGPGAELPATLTAGGALHARAHELALYLEDVT